MQAPWRTSRPAGEPGAERPATLAPLLVAAAAAVVGAGAVLLLSSDDGPQPPATSTATQALFRIDPLPGWRGAVPQPPQAPQPPGLPAPPVPPRPSLPPGLPQPPALPPGLRQAPAPGAGQLPPLPGSRAPAPPGAGTALARPQTWHEVRRPDGEKAGTLLFIHGGGWRASPSANAVAAKLIEHAYLADKFGWKVHAIGYRSGADSIRDVVDWYDRLRPDRGPFCAYGESAGGHLALMLAVHRKLDCVIAEGAPTYLAPTDAPWELPERTLTLARSMFGAGVEELSPLAHVSDIDEALLLGHAREDPLVPYGQTKQLKKKRPKSTRIVLVSGPGPKQFTHADHGIDKHDGRRWRRAKKRILAQAAG